MLLLMVVAAVVSVAQLAVLGSWARSLRITTLLQGIAVGFLGCGFVAVALQFGWTRVAAAVTSTPVAEVQRFAGWTVDPFIEEIVKVAPLLLLVWLRPRIQRQLGYTDHLLYGAALGMGFELLEAALRYGRLGLMTMATGDGYVVGGGITGIVTVPSIWQSLFSWQPVPANFEDLFATGGDTIQHLVWTALAAVGVAWFARRKDAFRWLGIVPLWIACIDHANYNLRAQSPDQAWWSDALAWLGGQLWWMLIVALLATTAADRVIRARTRRAGTPSAGPPMEYGLGSMITSAFVGFPWSTWVTWQFVLSRRAAATALAAGETSPHLRDGVAQTAAELARAARLPRREATRLWRDAVKQVWSGVDWRALRSPKMIIWVVALLPALAYLVVGGFPATRGLQLIMNSQVGLWLLVAGVVAGGVLVVLQLKPLRARLRAVTEPALHERRLRPQAQLVAAAASLCGGVIMIALAVVERDPSARVVSTFHVLDAISDALLVLGLALILGSFFLFPPFALVGVVGGGTVIVSTVSGSFVIATTAGAIIAALGMLMNQSGGNPPPRFTDNTGQSRTYGGSVSDIKGQANRWAERMRRRGYEVWVGGVREGRYGPNARDVTVVLRRNGVVQHIRHFIFRGP